MNFGWRNDFDAFFRSTAKFVLGPEPEEIFCIPRVQAWATLAISKRTVATTRPARTQTRIRAHFWQGF